MSRLVQPTVWLPPGVARSGIESTRKLDLLAPANLRVIIADNYAVFRTGLARFLVVEDDFKLVGQCDDLTRLYKTVQITNGAVVVFASSLKPSLSELTQSAGQNNIRFVAMLDPLESPRPYVRHNIDGIMFRDVSRVEALRCLRTVGRGGKYMQQASADPSEHLDSEMVGQRARDRLSKKDLQIIGLVIQGYKNKDIAEELNNTEQVIKNRLRSIFDKTGVSDRLELALFTLHHRILLDAVGGMNGAQLEPNSHLARAIPVDCRQ
jgi:DNA-binding NarL/FixJ family response regulator